MYPYPSSDLKEKLRTFSKEVESLTKAIGRKDHYPPQDKAPEEWLKEFSEFLSKMSEMQSLSPARKAIVKDLLNNLIPAESSGFLTKLKEYLSKLSARKTDSPGVYKPLIDILKQKTFSLPASFFEDLKKKDILSEDLQEKKISSEILDVVGLQQIGSREFTAEELLHTITDLMKKEPSEQQNLDIWESALKDVIDNVLKEHFQNLKETFDTLIPEEEPSIWMTELCPKWDDMSVEEGISTSTSS
jgi:hypothetical protein